MSVAKAFYEADYRERLEAEHFVILLRLNPNHVSRLLPIHSLMQL